MKYNVGDRVRIKSLDWYNENKTSEGCLVCGSSHINPEMICMLGKIATISSVEGNHYRIKEYGWNWTDEMIEGLVEENINIDIAVEETTKDISDKVVDTIMGGLMVGKSFNLPQGYVFKDENGNVINAQKIVLEKKKKEYPKTYEECCEALEYIPHTDDIIGYKWDILQSLQKLLICRDAYWKIAGEEMGLEKPWEPDWDNLSTNHEFIKINKGCFTYSSRAFVFPTPEMRDAFKENFDPDIEICKELL